MRPRSLLVLALLLLAVLVLGRVLLLGPGGPQPSPGSRGSVERLALALTPDAEPQGREVQVVARYLPTEGTEDWTIDADEHDVRTQRVPDGTFEGLWMRDDERMELAIPIPRELGLFNQVALHLYGRGDKKDVLVRVRGRGFSLASSAQRFPGNSPQTVVLDLGGVRQFDGPIEELRVSITAQNQLGDVAVESINLLHKPVSSWLPLPESPAMVDIEFDARRCVGLSNSAPLSGSFTARAGSELRFAYGQPRALQRPGEEARVHFVLEGPEGVVREERLSLGENPRWQEHAVDLSSLAGTALRATFRLEARGEGVSVAALGVPVHSTAGTEAPSVLLVTSDTHRRDYVGYARSGVEVNTPFLDALAARGVHFTDCFATTNITNPSHVALMTATDPRDTGVVDNISPLSDAAPTLAEAFADAGYLTYAAVSARHLGFDQSGLGQGFDRMAAPSDPQRDSMQTIDLLEDWLEEAQGRPLFAWLHIFDAHSPYLPPEEYRRLYYPADRDPEDPSLPDPPEGSQPTWLRNVRDLDYVIALYKGEVTYLDEQLSRFITGSRFEQGPLIVTSDHGESMTAHNIWFEHKGIFPNTLGVPMIVVGPGVPAGRRVEHAVRQTDSARTLLDLAGIRAPEIPGLSLLEQVEEPRVDARYSISSHGHDASIQVGDWYLVLHLLQPAPRFYDTPKQRHQVQLFDLASDPRCLRDLAQVEPQRARRLRELLVDWLCSARASRWNEGSAVIDAAEAEALAGLGYADDGAGPTSSNWIDPDCRCPRCRHYREE